MVGNIICSISEIMGVFSKIKTNNSTFFSKTKCEDGHNWWVSFEFYPFAVGERHTVFEGRMYNQHGYWSQSKAVVKSLNDEIGSENNLQFAITCSEKSRSLADTFKDEFPNTKHLKFAQPCLSEMDSVSVFNTPFRYIKGYEKQLAEHEHVLIEEFIDGDYQLFIDSDGIRRQESELLDTFLHYSYVESNGDFVICKLEGVERDKDIKLSGVSIHSRNRSFGPCDHGEQGILNVFKNHRCNDICKNWPTPAFGLVPSAPVGSETKIDIMDILKSDAAVLFSSKTDLVSPPPYENLTNADIRKIEDRPMVHGQCIQKV